jgi:hypothetical protein
VPDPTRSVPVLRLLAGMLALAVATAASAACAPPNERQDADFDAIHIGDDESAADAGEGLAASRREVDRYAGCYKPAAAMDTALAARSHLGELPRVFELREMAHHGLSGYRLIGVPPAPDGSPSVGGGWRIRGDSVLVVWQTQHHMYGMTVALAGDTLRGSGGPVRFEGRRRIYHPFPGVVLERRPCLPGQLVPAGIAPPRREPPHPVAPRQQAVALLSRG